MYIFGFDVIANVNFVFLDLVPVYGYMFDALVCSFLVFHDVPFSFQFAALFLVWCRLCFSCISVHSLLGLFHVSM